MRSGLGRKDEKRLRTSLRLRKFRMQQIVERPVDALITWTTGYLAVYTSSSEFLILKVNLTPKH